jgi:hypothetical protein
MKKLWQYKTTIVNGWHDDRACTYTRVVYDWLTMDEILSHLYENNEVSRNFEMYMEGKDNALEQATTSDAIYQRYQLLL